MVFCGCFVANKRWLNLLTFLLKNFSWSQCDQIWRNFKHLWIIFNGLISIWQIYEPTLAILYALGQFFISSHCLERTHPLMNLIDFKKEFQAILQTTIRISRQPIESAILSKAFSLIIH